jgi:ABC-type branched-subunit amino acid transport system ATPase component
MLRVHELTVSFGGVRPLDGVSLEPGSGVFGVVGPNGAGKTTLFNVISGFITPASGIVESDGDSLLAMAPHQRARWGLRRTFQQEQVIQELSALDNVRLAADELGGDAEEAERALAFVGVSRTNRRGAALSLLERRLVELARAVVAKPRLVLLDEPGAGLVDAETDRLAELIRQMPERYGAQVILVDHDMELVSAVCGAIAVLDFGKVIGVGATDEVLADDEVKRAYLGDEVLL